jgi:hypothetical protein
MDTKPIARLALLLLILMPGLLPAQELIFERQVAPENKVSNFGPNRRTFVHPFLSASLIMSAPDEAIKINMPGSISLAGGLRYKLRLAKPLAFVADGSIWSMNYRIREHETTPNWDSLSNPSSSIKIHGLSGTIGLRFRFGQKGNYLGNYLEVGLSTQLPVTGSFITRYGPGDPQQDGVYSEITSRSTLRDYHPVLWQAIGRLGFDKFSMVVAYRLSDMLKPIWMYDLPRLTVGLEFSLVKY